MRTALTLLTIAAALIAGCGSPPKPPTVDASQRRPANTPMAAELQSCRNELQNTRLLALETGRAAQTSAATLAQLAAQRSATGEPPSATSALGNAVVTLRFGLGRTQVDLPAEQRAALVEAAKAAPLVLLRGRTDGERDNLADSRLARERAAAVRDVLVAAGVDPARIRATYQPVGDGVADNLSAGGRALNRRVEVELYRVLPAPLVMPPTTAP